MPQPPFLRLNIDGGPVVIRLRRSASARRYSLRVSASARDALLTMPARGSIASAEAFARRHAAWLAEQLGALPAAVPLAPGSTVPFRGMPHDVVHAPGVRSVGVTGPDGRPQLVVGGAAESITRRLAAWLKGQARQEIEAAASRYAAALDRPIQGVRLGDPKSRWGSCSSHGRLAFSWRLILAPPPILDYVAAHEAAHLVEMNHGPRFWRLVATLYPGHEEARAWLRRHGPELHRYG